MDLLLLSSTIMVLWVVSLASRFVVLRVLNLSGEWERPSAPEIHLPPDIFLGHCTTGSMQLTARSPIQNNLQ